MNFVKESVGDWYEPFQDLWESDGVKQVLASIQQDRGNGNVFPYQHQVFDAFRLTPYEKTKIIFMGGYPSDYVIHGIPVANGLLFDISQVTKYGFQTTLEYTKIYHEYSAYEPDHFNINMIEGVLSNWAKKGVLLLNSNLTVKEGQPWSHNDLWAPFTKGLLSRMKDRMTSHPPIIAFGDYPYQLCKDEFYPNVKLLPEPMRGHSKWQPVLGGNMFEFASELMGHHIEW